MEATLSLFIPLLAVNDEIRLVSMKSPHPLNHKDCRDRFYSHKDKQVRDKDLHNGSLESLLFSYTLLCFLCVCMISNDMPSSSAAHFSGIPCCSLLLMQLQGLWEYRDETKRPFQICALKIKGTKESNHPQSDEDLLVFSASLFFSFPKCMAA